MRVCIRHPLHGVIDAVNLRLLVPAVTYELPDSLAMYLLETGAASPADKTEVAIPAPFADAEPYDDPSLYDAVLTGGVTGQLPGSMPDDRPAKRKPVINRKWPRLQKAATPPQKGKQRAAKT